MRTVARLPNAAYRCTGRDRKQCFSWGGSDDATGETSLEAEARDQRRGMGARYCRSDIWARRRRFRVNHTDCGRAAETQLHAERLSGEPVILGCERLDGRQNLAHARDIRRLFSIGDVHCCPGSCASHLAMLPEVFALAKAFRSILPKFRQTSTSFLGLVRADRGLRAQAPERSSTSFPPAVRPPPPALEPRSEGRDWRGQTTETTMKLDWTMTELMYLTRDELRSPARLA